MLHARCVQKKVPQVGANLCILALLERISCSAHHSADLGCLHPRCLPPLGHHWAQPIWHKFALGMQVLVVAE